MRVWLPRRTDRRWAPAAHTRSRAASGVRARVRVGLGADASAPTHASAFRRHGLHMARLAGVRRCAGVQREHRRVEHRACHQLVSGMRCLFEQGRDALSGSSVRRSVVYGGGAGARARVCADVWARACAGVPMRYGCALERRVICMYVVYIYICMHDTYVSRYISIYVRGMGVHAAALPAMRTRV
jgi:hypothetical protein